MISSSHYQSNDLSSVSSKDSRRRSEARPSHGRVLETSLSPRRKPNKIENMSAADLVFGKIGHDSAEFDFSGDDMSWASGLEDCESENESASVGSSLVIKPNICKIESSESDWFSEISESESELAGRTEKCPRERKKKVTRRTPGQVRREAEVNSEDVPEKKPEKKGGKEKSRKTSKHTRGRESDRAEKVEDEDGGRSASRSVSVHRRSEIKEKSRKSSSKHSRVKESDPAEEVEDEDGGRSASRSVSVHRRSENTEKSRKSSSKHTRGRVSDRAEEVEDEDGGRSASRSVSVHRRSENTEKSRETSKHTRGRVSDRAEEVENEDGGRSASRSVSVQSRVSKRSTNRSGGDKQVEGLNDNSRRGRSPPRVATVDPAEDMDSLIKEAKEKERRSILDKSRKGPMRDRSRSVSRQRDGPARHVADIPLIDDLGLKSAEGGMAYLPTALDRRKENVNEDRFRMVKTHSDRMLNKAAKANTLDGHMGAVGAHAHNFLSDTASLPDDDSGRLSSSAALAGDMKSTPGYEKRMLHIDSRNWGGAMDDLLKARKVRSAAESRGSGDNPPHLVNAAAAHSPPTGSRPGGRSASMSMSSHGSAGPAYSPSTGRKPSVHSASMSMSVHGSAGPAYSPSTGRKPSVHPTSMSMSLHGPRLGVAMSPGRASRQKHSPQSSPHALPQKYSTAPNGGNQSVQVSQRRHSNALASGNQSDHLSPSRPHPHAPTVGISGRRQSTHLSPSRAHPHAPPMTGDLAAYRHPRHNSSGHGGGAQSGLPSAPNLGAPPASPRRLPKFLGALPALPNPLAPRKYSTALD